MNDEDRVFAKCAWRLLPFMMLVFLVSLIDRVNVGFAALTMNSDLGFSPTVFGLGAGIFFVGFFFCQVPSSLAFTIFGVRRTLFFITAGWGICSMANALAEGPASFYLLRFLLGIAEAGLFPGLLLYLTYWFPETYRARHTANFMMAAPLSNILGGPLASLILGLDGTFGLHGWQLLFLIEGLPACILAFAVFKILPDTPGDAPWLNVEEKSLIASRLDRERGTHSHDFLTALRDPRVLALGLVIFGILFGAYGTVFWLPQVVQEMGFSNFATGYVSAAPFVVGLAGMMFWARSSDAKGERVWHVALPSFLTAAGFAVASLSQSYVVVLLGLTVATVGINAFYAPFYSLPPAFLKGRALAGGTALIYAIGSLGAFLGPFIIGVLKDHIGGYSAAMAALALGSMMSALVVLALGRAMAPGPAMIQRKAGSAE